MSAWQTGEWRWYLLRAPLATWNCSPASSLGHLLESGVMQSHDVVWCRNCGVMYVRQYTREVTRKTMATGGAR